MQRRCGPHDWKGGMVTEARSGRGIEKPLEIVESEGIFYKVFISFIYIYIYSETESSYVARLALELVALFLCQPGCWEHRHKVPHPTNHLCNLLEKGDMERKTHMILVAQGAGD